MHEENYEQDVARICQVLRQQCAHIKCKERGNKANNQHGWHEQDHPVCFALQQTELLQRLQVFWADDAAAPQDGLAGQEVLVYDLCLLKRCLARCLRCGLVVQRVGHNPVCGKQGGNAGLGSAEQHAYALCAGGARCGQGISPHCVAQGNLQHAQRIRSDRLPARFVESKNGLCFGLGQVFAGALQQLAELLGCLDVCICAQCSDGCDGGLGGI